MPVFDTDYDRLGLPPPRPADTPRTRRRRLAIAALGIAAICAVVGWSGGHLLRRWQIRVFTGDALGLFARMDPVHPADSVAELSGLRERRLALSSAPQARLALATALYRMAAIHPERHYYLEATRVELDDRAVGRAWSGQSQELKDRWRQLQGIVLLDLGDDDGALAAMDAADAGLRRAPDRLSRSLALNNRAYLLATAKSPGIRDPEQALDLARQAVLMRPAADAATLRTWSASTLDTLAAAQDAAGRRDWARTTQTLALGLADPEELCVFLERYDRLAAPETARP